MDFGCVCFDLDNTLIDYEMAFERGMHYTFEHFVKKVCPESSEIIRQEWFVVFKHLSNKLWELVETQQWTKRQYKVQRFLLSLKHFDIVGDEETAKEFQAYFYSIVHRFVEPYDGVYALLTKLDESKIPIGIITNGASKTQHRKIRQAGLNKWVRKQNIFISDEWKVAKPSAEIFHIADRQLNLSSLPSIYIGDSWELDIMGAINAGWETIYYNSRYEQPKTPHQPMGVCYTIKDIKKFLFS